MRYECRRCGSDDTMPSTRTDEPPEPPSPLVEVIDGLTGHLETYRKVLRDLVLTLDDAGEPWPELEAARELIRSESRPPQGEKP